jgi:hypothetical protein
MRFLACILAMGMVSGQTPKPASPSNGVPQWRIKFFHDENETAIDFHEVVAPAKDTVCAFGWFNEQGRRPRGVMVTSRDGGQSWQTIKLPDLPLSADFVDASNGWLVTPDAVHRTLDGGLTWKRSAKLRGVGQVKFVTPRKGFAVGYPKAIWSTEDGGVTWAKVPEAAVPAAKPENTTYSTVTFPDAEHGIITGFSKPPRRDEPRVPAWMDPEVQKRLVPNLTLVLETKNGGQTWSTQVASALGQVVRIAWGRIGLGLMEYTAGSFRYSSEVLNLSNSKSAFADAEKAIKDIAFDGDGRAWIAGVLVPGTLNQLPIPSKLTVLQSIDFEHWYTAPVDYKAVANRVRITFAGKQGWLATDTGMILTLQ